MLYSIGIQVLQKENWLVGDLDIYTLFFSPLQRGGEGVSLAALIRKSIYRNIIFPLLRFIIISHFRSLSSLAPFLCINYDIIRKNRNKISFGLQR